MGLDIRLPIGLMFAIVGLLVLFMGLFGDAAMYDKSLGYNLNLWWGLGSLGFGALFIFLSRKNIKRLAGKAQE